MNIYSVAEIEDKELLPPQMTVEGLLPVGMCVLAGSPKLGKSWLVLNLAYSVAMGTKFLNHPTSQGEVLYIDLEGSQYRIKDRMQTLNYSFPKELQIAHEAAEFGNGLIEELEHWWSCADNPKLIIIDTIGRLKTAGHKSLNAYENDSKIFAPLQKFALENSITVLLVTHLNKAPTFKISDADWMERISGSMGLAGCCDSVWVLLRKRNELTAFLRTTSRDIESADIVCEFDNGQWKFISDDVDNYAFMNNPLVKYFSQIEHFHGYVDELYEGYLKFCLDNNLPHGLSDSQPKASFGKQLKPLMVQGWRINRSITRARKADGVYYWICANDDYAG